MLTPPPLGLHSDSWGLVLRGSTRRACAAGPARRLLSCRPLSWLSATSACSRHRAPAAQPPRLPAAPSSLRTVLSPPAIPGTGPDPRRPEGWSCGRPRTYAEGRVSERKGHKRTRPCGGGMCSSGCGQEWLPLASVSTNPQGKRGHLGAASPALWGCLCFGAMLIWALPPRATLEPAGSCALESLGLWLAEPLSPLGR